MKPPNSDISVTEFNRVYKSYLYFLNQIEETSNLLDYASKLQTENFRVVWSVASRSAIIMSSGFLERYLRDSFMEFIEQINIMNIDIEKYVKHEILKTNKAKTLRLLKLINDKKFDADYEQIIMVYASSFDGSPYKPVFVKETFSLLDTYNPGKNTIEQLFSSIGVPHVFKHDVFKNLNYLGGVDGKLKEFIGFRNSFAHGGSGTTIPSLNDTQDIIEFLKTFVCRLNKILDDEVLFIEMKFHRDYFRTFPHVYE